jgi:hypothetical protein
MKRSFFYFAWREFIRSASVNKNIATKGLLIFLALYLSLAALAYGLMLSDHITRNFPGQPQVQVFNSLIFIYIGIDLVMRIFIQNLPTFGFQPFLTIPVKRTRIIRYMLSKSLLHFFNFVPLLLIIPFTLKSAGSELTGIQLSAWLFSLFFLILINHFLAIYLKWRTNESNWFFYGFLAIAVGIYCISYFGIFDITSNFGKIFDSVLQQPVLSLLFAFVATIFYFLNFRYIKSRFYLDELVSKKKNEAIHSFSWLNQVGDYGKMLSLEVKMIARNKRPRNAAMMSFLFILYGLLIYRQPEGKEVPMFMMVFGGMFMTGVFSMMYGQFFPAWHSRYYPFLMAQNVKMKQILQSAFFLMASTNIVFYLLSLGYILVSPKVIYVHLAVMLYNVGVNSFVIFALGLNSRKSVDLDQRAAFNYQGVGATQWLMTFPILFGPLAIYGLFYLAAGEIGALVALGTLGILGIILHPRLIEYFSKQYLKRKHKMIASYKAS